VKMPTGGIVDGEICSSRFRPEWSSYPKHQQPTYRVEEPVARGNECQRPPSGARVYSFDGVERTRSNIDLFFPPSNPETASIDPASPILANLFMHYTFDLWMARTHPDLLWCRYADDGLVHCRAEQEAEALKAELQARLAECHLEMHPTKTKVIYCKDGKRKANTRISNLIFSGTAFGLVWFAVSEITHCLEDSIQQSAPRR
jgi:hypothetical protein